MSKPTYDGPKPNRKTWIIGTAGSAQVKFPPVVPRLTAEIRDGLIELFAKHLAIEPDTRQLKEQIAAFDRQPFLSPVQMRQLKVYHSQLDELETQIRRARTEAEPKARSYALNLCLARGVTSVQTVDGLLQFTTAPIVINKVILGRYDVMIDLTQTVPYNAILAHRHWDRSKQGRHPHWSEANPCFGDAGPVMDRLLRARRWTDLVGVILVYLATYYAGSPLIRLEQFKPGGMHFNSQAALDSNEPNWWDWKFPSAAQARRNGIDWAQRSPDPHIPF
jgi:hypothetical protein